MPGRSEETSVGEHVPEVLAARWGLLQEHAHVMRLITQPGEERQGRIERSRSDISFAIVP